MTLDTRPAQFRHDVDELCNALRDGGTHLCNLTFKSIIVARNLSTAEVSVLAIETSDEAKRRGLL